MAGGWLEALLLLGLGALLLMARPGRRRLTRAIGLSPADWTPRCRAEMQRVRADAAVTSRACRRPGPALAAHQRPGSSARTREVTRRRVWRCRGLGRERHRDRRRYPGRSDGRLQWLLRNSNTIGNAQPSFVYKRRGEFLVFLRYMRALYRPGVRIGLVLDNFSPHLSTKDDPRVGDWTAANNVELAYTPTNASWLNRIEAQFQALRYYALDGTDHASHHAQASMIRRYIAGRNRNAHNRRFREIINRANVA
jgi:transposase